MLVLSETKKPSEEKISTYPTHESKVDQDRIIDNSYSVISKNLPCAEISSPHLAISNLHKVIPSAPNMPVALFPIINIEKKIENENKLITEGNNIVTKKYTSNGKTEIPLNNELDSIISAIRAVTAHPQKTTFFAFQSSIILNWEKSKDILFELANILRNEISCIYRSK